MFGRGNVGKFGKSLVVCQILPSKLMINTINKANKQKFTKVLLAKAFCWEILQSFPPPNIHAIR